MDFITIGHACHDTAPFGFLPGGAVTYSALFAHQLGLKTGVLTSVGTDYLFKNLFEGIQFKTVPSKTTTLFDNQEINGQRQQYLLARADDIHCEHLPKSWKEAKMVFIAPITNELDFGFLNQFKNALVCVNPQGWMRRWDEQGKVFYKPFKNYELLAKADVVIVSEEDIQSDDKTIREMIKFIRNLVITKGAKGCELYIDRQKFSSPAFKTSVVDTTGAGDIFSAAFLIFYYKTGDLLQSAKYANVAASFVIESQGIDNLPNLKQIEERMRGI